MVRYVNTVRAMSSMLFRSAQTTLHMSWLSLLYQAEDVISNLLKEYAVEDDDEQIPEPEAGNENGKASEPGADGKISEPEAGGKVSEPGADGQVSEPETDGKASETEADGKVSVEQVTTTAENGQQEATKRRFKNIVAIVDPPRVGLHHVVSIGIILVSCHFQYLVNSMCNLLSQMVTPNSMSSIRY